MRAYITRLLKELIRQRTVNYDLADYPGRGPDGMQFPGEEYKVAAIVERELKKLNIRCRVFNEETRRPDVFAFIGRGEKGYRKLLIAAHMDTVPSGSGWSVTAPFAPKLVDGRLYGRGAEDNKGQLAALLAAAKLLKAKDIRGQVVLAAVSDEEVRMCPGLADVIARKKVVVTDAIIPDVSGNMKKIVVAEKGRLLVAVTAKGRAAHASRPQLGVNAINGMAQFLSLLSQHQLAHDDSPLFPDGPTINAGLIKGGEAPNQVPDTCESILDIRYLPSQQPRRIVAELKRISGDVPDTLFAFVIRDDHRPMSVAPETPLVTAIRRHAQASLVGIGGGTVNKVLVRHGIPSVGFSAGDEGAAHVADEWIVIDELVSFAGVITKIAVDVANMRVA